MRRGTMIFIYILLSAGVIGTAIPFGFELREYLYEEKAENGEDVVLLPTPTPPPTPTPEPWKVANSVLGTFRDVKVFQPVTTPKPTPTRIPTPTPTPAPPPVAEGYRVESCIGSQRALLISYTLKRKVVKVGQVVSEDNGDFKIITIDSAAQRVEVEDVAGGHRAWIEKAKGKKKAATGTKRK